MSHDGWELINDPPAYPGLTVLRSPHQKAWLGRPAVATPVLAALNGKPVVFGSIGRICIIASHTLPLQRYS